jgi:hypothetical protein
LALWPGSGEGSAWGESSDMVLSVSISREARKSGEESRDDF